MRVHQEQVTASPQCNRTNNVSPLSESALSCGDYGGNGQDGFSSTPPPSTRIRKKTHVDFGETAVCYYSDQALYEDALDQWNALVTREGAYSYQGPPLAANDISQRDRERLCLWCYRVVDHLDLDRAPVAMALSHLDRLLATNLVDRTEISLALITSLYITLKTNSHGGQRTITPGIMAVICNGRFTADGIVNMERRICQGLRWRLNPPVADSYLNIIKSILMDAHMNVSSLGSRHRATHDEESQGVLHHLVLQSKFLCERSVLDSFFVGKSPSSIAYAAASGMLRLMQFPRHMIQWFLSLPLHHNAEETDVCAKRIRHVSSVEGYCPVVTYSPAVTFSHCHGASWDGKEEGRPKIWAMAPSKDKGPSSMKKFLLEGTGVVSPTTTGVMRPHSSGAMDQNEKAEYRILHGSPKNENEQVEILLGE